MPKKVNTWTPTIDQEEFIRENYGKMTKTAISRKYGISVRQFEEFCIRRGIYANFDQKHATRDFRGYVRIPIPSIGTTQSFVLVKPHLVKKVREKYGVQDHVKEVLL